MVKLFKKRVPKKVHKEYKDMYRRYLDNNQELEGLVETLNADREFSCFVHLAGEMEIYRDDIIYGQYKSQRKKLEEERGTSFLELWLLGLVDMPNAHLYYEPSCGLCIYDWKKTNTILVMESKKGEDFDKLLEREMINNAVHVTETNIRNYFPQLTAETLRQNVLGYIEKYSTWASWMDKICKRP